VVLRIIVFPKELEGLPTAKQTVMAGQLIALSAMVVPEVCGAQLLPLAVARIIPLAPTA
jgi:hypothetical protein